MSKVSKARNPAAAKDAGVTGVAALAAVVVVVVSVSSMSDNGFDGEWVLKSPLLVIISLFFNHTYQ
jgi:hypothetical protein